MARAEEGLGMNTFRMNKTLADCVTVITSTSPVQFYLVILWEGTFKVCTGRGKRRVKVRIPPEKMRRCLI